MTRTPSRYQSRPEASQYLTNLATITIDDAEIEIGVFGDYDRDTHHRLAAAHAETHLFRRYSDDLQAVQIRAGAERIGDRFEMRAANQCGWLTQALLEASIVRHLRTVVQRTTRVIRDDPPQFVSLEPKNDLVHHLFCKRTQRTLPLKIRRCFELQTRQVNIGKHRQFALAIFARTSAAIEWDCAQLIADRVDLRGLYVREKVHNEYDEETSQSVGVVDRVDGNRILLGKDRRDDRTELQADAAWLEASSAAQRRLLEHYAGPGSFEKLFDERGEISAGSERWKRLENFRAKFAEKPFELVPGVQWRLGNWIDISQLKPSRAPEAKFVFKAGHVSEKATDALFRGPYLAPPKFSKTLKACIICESAERHTVERFARELRDGMRKHRALKSSWGIADLSWRVFPAAAATADAYTQACRAAFDMANTWDIAFVQVPGDRHDAPLGDDNPYLVTKAKFLSRNIPVQEFTNDTMHKPEDQRQWALRGIGLQICAKMGGLPWLLQTGGGAGHEIVLGIGSANIGTGRFGKRERIVGLTTAFSGDGTYWLAEVSRLVPYEEHEAALGEALCAAVSRVKNDIMAWKRGDSARIILHSFKPFRGAYVDHIHTLLEELRNDGVDVKCAFVHVVEHHPILLFDTANEQKIAPHGLIAHLGHREVLVSVLGPDDVRRGDSGFPRPLLLRIHEDSTFDDITYIANQVVAFSAHSWRNFGRISLPVTIQYSDLIAGLLGRLGNLSKWDPDILRGDVSQSRWFL